MLEDASGTSLCRGGHEWPEPGRTFPVEGTAHYSICESLEAGQRLDAEEHGGPDTESAPPLAKAPATHWGILGWGMGWERRAPPLAPPPPLSWRILGWAPPLTTPPAPSLWDSRQMLQGVTEHSFSEG